MPEFHAGGALAITLGQTQDPAPVAALDPQAYSASIFASFTSLFQLW
jgi:hypothetical protein